MASSFAGRRRLASLSPFQQRDDAEQELERVAGLVATTSAGHGLPLLEIDDLRPAFAQLRAEGAVLGPDELLGFLPLLRGAHEAKRCLEAVQLEHPELAELAHPLVVHPHLSRALDETFDPSTGAMRDSASPALKRIRRERETMRERLRARMERMAARLTTSDAETLVTLRDGRFVLAVPQSQRSQVQGMVQDRSASGATVYLEPMEALDENNGLRELDAEEREEMRRILAELSARFAAERPALTRNWEHLGYLDALNAKVKLALRWKANPPAFTDQSRLELRGARHPLLLEGRGVERDASRAFAEVIPLTVSFSPETRLLLLTGPNMGGKTVALKCVGLCTALAQSGCLIPTDPGAVLPWLDHWVVSLGDEQSLDQDLSTFGAHLARWSEALRVAGPGTLVLLDELGSGTDPLEGAALARSVLERLVESNSLGLVTTHLGVLKGFAAETPGLQNASMAFDLDGDGPTYSLAPGIPGESHALDMARRLGFPEERVARAEALLPREERDLKRLLQELEGERKRLGEERAAVRAELTAAEASASKHKAELDRLMEKRAEVRAKAARQAREVIRKAEDRLRQVERQVRGEKVATPISRKSLQRDQVELARLERRRSAAPRGVVPTRVEAGRRYWAEALEREVEVVREPDPAGRVLVSQGGLRVELPVGTLRVLGGSGPAEVVVAAPAPSSQLPENESASPEVKLLGMRVDEALSVLEQAVDRALLAGLGELRVVHGKGTGALRSAVQAFGRDNPGVRATRVAEQWQGGLGATILELKV